MYRTVEKGGAWKQRLQFFLSEWCREREQSLARHCDEVSCISSQWENSQPHFCRWTLHWGFYSSEIATVPSERVGTALADDLQNTGQLSRSGSTVTASTRAEDIRWEKFPLGQTADLKAEMCNLIKKKTKKATRHTVFSPCCHSSMLFPGNSVFKITNSWDAESPCSRPVAVP